MFFKNACRFLHLKLLYFFAGWAIRQLADDPPYASIKDQHWYAVQVRFFFSFTKRKEEQNKFTTMFGNEQMPVPKNYLITFSFTIFPAKAFL
jgi:hypothetical protein